MTSWKPLTFFGLSHPQGHFNNHLLHMRQAAIEQTTLSNPVRGYPILRDFEPRPSLLANRAYCAGALRLNLTHGATFFHRASLNRPSKGIQ